MAAIEPEPEPERRRISEQAFEAGMARVLDVLTGAAGLGALAALAAGDRQYAAALGLSALGCQLLREA